jgi:plastocyanin
MIKTVFDDLIAELKRIKPETIYSRSVTTEALEEAANANRDQLDKGMLDNGQTTGGYAKNTETKYNDTRTTKVSAGDAVKFKDTGKFHKTIKAKVTRDGEIKITSASKKLEYAKDYISGKSGNVLGLTDENLQAWYKQFVEDDFKRNLLNRILYGA